MTGTQFLTRIKQGATPPAGLLLGVEAYQRRRIKAALVEALSESAVTQFDLAEISLAEILDDARALSLFSSERLIWVINAELAMPRVRASTEDDAEGEFTAAAGDAAPLAAYVKDPTPGVTLVFEASRFDFDGDDKRRLERVRKFYSALGDPVELRKYSAPEARAEAELLIARAGIRVDRAALDLLVESLGADMARIAVEIEKLALFAAGRVLVEDDITALVPDARATTIFALVNALGRRDRARALGILDTLTREGEYLPLALAFLSSQFRMALAAREAGLKSPQQIVGHFSRMGVTMWGSRADQVYQTLTKFSKPQLERAMVLLYRADKGLRDARPDDRTVMEQFIMQLVV